MHLSASIVYGTSSLPQITWLDETHLRLSIHGKPLGLDQLREFMKRRVEAAQDQLEREVMFGHKIQYTARERNHEQIYSLNREI